MGFLYLTLPHHSPSSKEVGGRNSKQEPGAGAEAETREGEVLTHLALVASSACSWVRFRTTYPAMVPTTVGGGPSTAVIAHENALQTCLLAELMGAFSQLRFSLSSYIWVCVR